MGRYYSNIVSKLCLIYSVKHWSLVKRVFPIICWSHATSWGNRRYFRCQFHQHLTQSFYVRRSQKRKKTVKLSVFFVLSGSACKKAASWMLVKSPPDAAWQKCINWGELNIRTKNIRTKKNLCERERKVIFVSSLLTMMVSLFSGEIIPLEKWIHN